MHREGKLLLLIGLLDVILFTFLAVWFDSWIFRIIAIGAAILFFLIMQFFRNPARPIPQIDKNLLYTPADGKVVVIENISDFPGFDEEVTQISIFMSPFNVHVNRIPGNGKVIFSNHINGKYLVAWHPKSSSDNERQETMIETENGSYLIKQIAGAVAKRIICYVTAGQTVKQGEELGFIKFGSRVDVILPSRRVQVKVEMGQKVKGNVDVLAVWR